MSYYTLDTLNAGNSLGYLLKRCGIVVMQVAERGFGSQPVSFTQWTVLAQLSGQPHMTPTELRNNLGLDLGALTRIVDDLLEKGLVSRDRSETDRRAVRVAITAEGRRQCKAVMPHVVELNNHLVELLTKAETDTLISLLQRLLQHMERVVGESPPESAGNSKKTPATARSATVRRPSRSRRPTREGRP